MCNINLILYIILALKTVQYIHSTTMPWWFCISCEFLIEFK